MLGLLGYLALTAALGLMPVGVVPGPLGTAAMALPDRDQCMPRCDREPAAARPAQRNRPGRGGRRIAARSRYGAAMDRAPAGQPDRPTADRQSRGALRRPRDRKSVV